MAKVKGVEDVIQGQVLAAAWVEPKDAIRARLKQNLPGAVGGLAGGLASAALAGSVESKNTGLAATPEGLWLFPVKPGFANLKAQPGGQLIPRDKLASFEFGSAAINLPLTISTVDRDSIEFTVHKMNRKDVEAVKNALGL